MLSGLVKSPSYKPSFLQLAFETQPLCVSKKFFNCRVVLASGFL